MKRLLFFFILMSAFFTACFPPENPVREIKLSPMSPMDIAPACSVYLPKGIAEQFPVSGNPLSETELKEEGSARSGYGIMSREEIEYVLWTNSISPVYDVRLAPGQFAIYNERAAKWCDDLFDPLNYSFLIFQKGEYLSIRMQDAQTLAVRRLKMPKWSDKPATVFVPRLKHTAFFRWFISGKALERSRLDWGAIGIEVMDFGVKNDTYLGTSVWRGGGEIDFPPTMRSAWIQATDIKTRELMWEYQWLAEPVPAAEE